MALSAEELRQRLALVKERINQSAEKAGGLAGAVKLVAVSKTKSAEMIKSALELGQRDFGENYAQELRDKAAEIPDPQIRWHFIGSLQRNKVKYLVGKVAMIHSIDSASLIEEIEKRAAAQNISVPILLEVKLSEEQTKTGIDPAGLISLAEKAFASPGQGGVELKGLMTMPPYFPDPEQSRPYYVRLRKIRDDLEKKLGVKLPELSMGMSNDFEVAIQEGATIVRVGAAIFGEREQWKSSEAQ